MTDLNTAMTPGGSATVHVLSEGYVGRDGDDERVAGTVTLLEPYPNDSVTRGASREHPAS